MSTEPTIEAPSSREFIDVSPSAIILDENVRTIVDIDPDFYLSVKEHGVQQPVQVWRRDDGQLVLERGQRRLLAAQQSEREFITCEVIERPGADAREVERGRIIRQLGENDHRSGLAASEHVAATTALFELGMKPDEIAKATHRPRKVVREEVKLGRDHGRTVQVMGEEALPLDVAAQLVEFEDDEALHASLASTASQDPGEFRAVLKRAQQERQEELAIAEVRAAAEADGLEFVHPTVRRDAVTGEYEEFGYWLVHRERGEELTEEKAKELGIYVVSASQHGAWEDGEWVYRWQRRTFARNVAEHGYMNRHRQAARGPLTDQQKQERREKRERRAAWKIATEVRHEWIRANLLQQTKMPDGALLWIVKALLHHRDAYHSSISSYATDYLEFAETMLGITHDTDYGKERTALLAAIETGKGQSELRVGLAAAIGCMEHEISNPKQPRYGEDTTAANYLTQLEEWGYQLTEAERALVKTAKKRSRA
ncbi:hypothetical protein MUN78_07100 [Leucobacter allii]|uniref:ParB/Sulfiredoxin domain-containing protein n=1 Tax=Leucobacter allii TaxID=2932247 RepID=A0ABY4FQY6_9MICO|nr:ParB N-terminal domain-containing protein [Leucobacter allii]UOQ58584.1 hypothetical protein MUN78_07100 [Leucobacter allii]